MCLVSHASGEMVEMIARQYSKCSARIGGRESLSFAAFRGSVMSAYSYAVHVPSLAPLPYRLKLSLELGPFDLLHCAYLTFSIFWASSVESLMMATTSLLHSSSRFSSRILDAAS